MKRLHVHASVEDIGFSLGSGGRKPGAATEGACRAPKAAIA